MPAQAGNHLSKQSNAQVVGEDQSTKNQLILAKIVDM